MYCINCGVKLADTEKKCPLCFTTVYHPDLVMTKASPNYPKNKYPSGKISFLGIKVIVSAVFLIALLISFLCDMQISGKVSWSYYVMGALAAFYISFVLPFWFKKPSPIIFVPSAFAVFEVYVLFINLFTNGDWFLSFAFPVMSITALIVTTVVILLHFFKRATLHIFGFALIAFGTFMPLLELFLSITFDIPYIWWSLYPLTALVLIGFTVLFFAFCPSARESVERKFFI